MLKLLEATEIHPLVGFVLFFFCGQKFSLKYVSKKTE